MALIVSGSKSPAAVFDPGPLTVAAAQREEDEVRQEIRSLKSRGDTTLWLTNYEELQEIPEEIGELTQVYRITVQNCFALRRLSPNIGDLAERLERLEISYCQLEELPKEVCRLRYLQQLNCSNNHLRCVPSDIDQLRSLEEVCLDNNFITAFPPSLGYMKKLRKFSVYNNPLIDEDDQPYEPYRPPTLTECDLCKAPLEPDAIMLDMNFIDLVGNKSLPVAYFLCSNRCKNIVNELKDSEQTNYRILQYDTVDSAY